MGTPWAWEVWFGGSRVADGWTDTARAAMLAADAAMEGK
jgi:hypothetical protein